MESLFFGMIGWLVGWISTGLVLWTIGLLFLSFHSISLLFSNPTLAKVSLPAHLIFFALAALLCWGDFILIQWLAEKWPTAKTGMMVGAVIPGLTMIQMPFGMLRGAREISNQH